VKRREMSVARQPVRRSLRLHGIVVVLVGKVSGSLVILLISYF
jgi:hypothetical protein